MTCRCDQRENMVYLTRKCEFSASHYYYNPEFTPEENQRIFGKCANLNGHGHNYTLEVTVKGRSQSQDWLRGGPERVEGNSEPGSDRGARSSASEQRSAGVLHSRFRPPKIWPSPSGTGCKASYTWPSCIACAFTSCPISLSISTVNHEGPSDAALHFFGVASLA